MYIRFSKNTSCARMLLLLGIALCRLTCVLSAQNITMLPVPEETLEEWMLETDDESLAEDQLELLQQAAENPLNLNSAGYDELMEHGILNAFQVYSLIGYREKYGDFLSLQELQLVPGFHAEIVEKILPFVSLTGANPEPGETIRSWPYLKNSLLLKFKLTSPFPEGFTVTDDSLYRFHGPQALRHLTGSLSAGNDLSLKYCVQNDPGENVRWDSLYRGPDHQSFSLEWKPGGKNYRFILGDYRLTLAAGLMAGNSMTSKSAQTLPGTTYSRLSSVASSAESGFFRGLAGEARFGKVRSLLFVSSVKEDASPAYGKHFTTPITSGMHRNLKELSSRNNLRITTGGLHVEYQNKNSQAGVNLLAGHYSRAHVYRSRPDAHSEKDSSDYFASVSAEYSLGSPVVRISGEIATDLTFHPALQQRITARLHPLFNLSILYRNYHHEYRAPFAGSFGETSGTRNERGIYYGISSYPFSWLQVSVYADGYRFPWPRYGMPSPSGGTDFFFQGIISTSRRYRTELLLKTESSQLSASSEKRGIPELSSETHSRIMLRQQFDAGNGILLRSRIEARLYSASGEKHSGSYIGQDLVYNSPGARFRIATRFAVFDAMHWECRLYVWEDDMYRNFSMPLLYGRGTRFYLTGKAEVLPRMDVYFKFAVTGYDRMRTTGTGADSRTGKHFTECGFQMIWKFDRRPGKEKVTP
jgi:hypothetical protein